MQHIHTPASQAKDGLSVAFALAITIFIAAAGVFPPDPYSTLLLLGLAAALVTVLRP